MDRYKSHFLNDRFATNAGIELIECGPGHAKAQVEIRPGHMNAAGVVHGGMVFTLADFACGAALNAYGLVTLSVNASVSYFGKGIAGTLTAEAVEVSRSNRLSSCDVNVFDQSGTLIANFKGMGYITKEKNDLAG